MGESIGAHERASDATLTCVACGAMMKRIIAYKKSIKMDAARYWYFMQIGGFWHAAKLGNFDGSAALAGALLRLGFECDVDRGGDFGGAGGDVVIDVDGGAVAIDQ